MKHLNKILSRCSFSYFETKLPNRIHRSKYSNSSINDEKQCCKVTDNLIKQMVTFGQATYWTHPVIYNRTESIFLYLT